MSGSSPIKPGFSGNKTQWGILFISLALGLMGTYLLRLYMKQSILQISGGEMQTVLFTTQPITEGAPILPSMVEARSVPAAYANFRTVQANQQNFVIGQKTIVDVEKNQALLWTYFDLADRPELAQKLALNERAITLRVDQRSGMNGLLEVGDHVDVICSMEIPGRDLGEQKAFSRPLVQNVTILAINGRMMKTPRPVISDASGKKTLSPSDLAHGNLPMEADSSGTGTVTLKTSAEEAVLISFVESKGELRLVLRSREDVFVEAPAEISYGNLTTAPEANVAQPKGPSASYPAIYEEGVRKGSGYWPSSGKGISSPINLPKAQKILALELGEIAARKTNAPPSEVQTPPAVQP